MFANLGRTVPRECGSCCLPSLRRSEATKQIQVFILFSGLLRGACHRAGVRPTRWLAMTAFLELCVCLFNPARPYPRTLTACPDHRLYRDRRIGGLRGEFAADQAIGFGRHVVRTWITSRSSAQ